MFRQRFPPFIQGSQFFLKGVVGRRHFASAWGIFVERRAAEGGFEFGLAFFFFEDGRLRLFVEFLKLVRGQEAVVGGFAVWRAR